MELAVFESGLVFVVVLQVSSQLIVLDALVWEGLALLAFTLLAGALHFVKVQPRVKLRYVLVHKFSAYVQFTGKMARAAAE